MEAKHTEGRMYVEVGALFIDNDGLPLSIAKVYDLDDDNDDDVAEANAARLARCWNSHDALVAACKAARAFGSQGDTHEGLSVSEMLRAALALTESRP